MNKLFVPQKNKLIVDTTVPPMESVENTKKEPGSFKKSYRLNKNPLIMLRDLFPENLIHFFRESAKYLWMLLRATSKAIVFFATTLFGYFRKHPFHALLNIFWMMLLALILIASSDLHEHYILSQISERTTDKIISISRFTRNYSHEKVKSQGIREFMQAGAPQWAQREGIRAVLFHARKHGLSIEHQAVLLAIVEIESGFNPMAKAKTTTACGLFQFIAATGKSYDLSSQDCMNPWLNAQAGIQHYTDNYKKRVENKTDSLQGIEKVFKLFELGYYLHHDGPESTKPSDEVKAVVLEGTQFLIQMYSVLKEELAIKQNSPSFSERFNNKLWHVAGKMSFFLIFVKEFTRENLEKA